MYIEVMIALALGVFIGIITGIRQSYSKQKTQKHDCGHKLPTKDPADSG
jgi:hypothetical protein